MANQYLVVSDLHLCDIEDHPDGWKFYKRSKFAVDDEFSSLVTSFVSQQGPDVDLTIILNGDIFDFDLVTAVPDSPPWPVNSSERIRGLDPTESKSVWKLEHVLSQHPTFVDILARYVMGGGRLVYVMGNHDREFHFKGVREAFVAALSRRAAELGADFSEDNVLFEPWFYVVPGEIYAEHGQQYDHYTSFRHLLSPTVRLKRQEQIALPMGNLSNRLLMAKMGYFNPHTGDFILNVYSYFTHWLRKYAFTRRSLFFSWLWGSLVVISRLLKIRQRLQWRSADLGEQLDGVAARFGLDRKTIRALYKLQKPPITSMFYRIAREFWLDRVLIAIILTGGTIILALSGAPLWAKLMIPFTAFPLLYFIYEYLARGENIFTIETRFPKIAQSISHLLPVKVVTFGHTHVPRLIPLSRHISFVDTGTWAPMTSRKKAEVLEPGYRNYLYLTFVDGVPRIRFDSWMDKDPTKELEIRQLGSEAL